MHHEHVLIVEDEIKIAQLLRDYFTQAHYHVDCIADGNNVIEWVKTHTPSVILLDVMLPGKDGMQLVKELRAFSQVPILMLTARVEEIDRLLGLEFGADDYICKPFSPREVVARVKTILRRVNSHSRLAKNNIVSKKLILDEERYQVSIENQLLDLTAVEFQLLKPLMQEPGRIFSREQLMNNMYSDNRVVSDRTIDSHIKKLRKKLAAVTPHEEIIQSVYGVGYRLID